MQTFKNDTIDRAKAIFAENGDQCQIDAISLGEKLKAAGASNDEILDALRAHFALAGAAAEKKKAAAENDK